MMFCAYCLVSFNNIVHLDKEEITYPCKYESSCLEAIVTKIIFMLPKESTTEAQNQPEAKEVGPVVSGDQYNQLLFELHEFPDIAKNILKIYKIEALKDLPQKEYYTVLARIRKLKENWSKV